MVGEARLLTAARGECWWLAGGEEREAGSLQRSGSCRGSPARWLRVGGGRASGGCSWGCCGLEEKKKKE